MRSLSCVLNAHTHNIPSILYMYLIFPSFPQLPVATQLKQAVRSLGESGHTISDLKQRTKKAEEHADKMEKALNKAQTELLRRDREMAELRLEISAAQRHSFSESPDPLVERGDGSGGASLKVAQETIEQLKVHSWGVTLYK